MSQSTIIALIFCEKMRSFFSLKNEGTALMQYLIIKMSIAIYSTATMCRVIPCLMYVTSTGEIGQLCSLRNNEGFTGLEYLCQSDRNIDFVRKLASYGADINELTSSVSWGAILM